MREVFLHDNLGAPPVTKRQKIVAETKRKKGVMLREFETLLGKRGYSLSEQKKAAKQVNADASKFATQLIQKKVIMDAQQQADIHISSLRVQIEEAVQKYRGKTGSISKPLSGDDWGNMAGYLPTKPTAWAEPLATTVHTTAILHGIKNDPKAKRAGQSLQLAKQTSSLKRQIDVKSRLAKMSSQFGEEEMGKSFLKKAAGAVKKASKTVAKAAAKPLPKGVTPARALKAVASAGLSETKAGKKLEKKAAVIASDPKRLAKAVVTGGLSETKLGKVVEEWVQKQAKNLAKKLQGVVFDLVLSSVNDQMKTLQEYEKEVLKSHGLSGYDYEIGEAIETLDGAITDIPKLLKEFFKKKQKFLEMESLKALLKTLPAAYPNPLAAMSAALGNLSSLVQNVAAEAGRFVAMETLKRNVKNKYLKKAVSAVTRPGGVQAALQAEKEKLVSKVAGAPAKALAKVTGTTQAKIQQTMTKATGIATKPIPKPTAPTIKKPTVSVPAKPAVSAPAKPSFGLTAPASQPAAKPVPTTMVSAPKAEPAVVTAPAIVAPKETRVEVERPKETVLKNAAPEAPAVAPSGGVAKVPETPPVKRSYEDEAFGPLVARKEGTMSGPGDVTPAKPLPWLGIALFIGAPILYWVMMKSRKPSRGELTKKEGEAVRRMRGEK